MTGSDRRSQPLVRACVLGALAAAGLMVQATPAHAGVYTVHSCRTPDGAPATTSDWTVTTRNAGMNASGSSCPSGNFWLEMLSWAAHPKDDYLRATFRAPDGTTIRSYRLWRSVQIGHVYHWRYSEIPNGSWDSRVEFDHCYGENGCSGLGSQGSPFSPANLVGRTAGPNVTALDFHLTCGHTDTGSLNCDARTPAARLQLHRAEIEIEDRVAPQISGQPSGPLVTPGARLSGLQGVAVAATDRGGGVYLGQIEVDGRVVAESVLDPNGGLCGEPFTRAQPCKSSAAGTVTLDTAALPDGPHSVKVLVTDPTRTNVVAWGPVQVTTDNNACNPRPASRDLLMSAWGHAAGGRGSRERSRRTLRVRYGTPVQLGGRLHRAQGAPLAGATVCVLARRDSSFARTRQVATLTTDQAGRFSYRLRPGTSRRISFVHRTGAGSVVRSVRVAVPAPVRLRPSRPSFVVGDTLVLRGRLAGRPLPRGGALVVFQAKQERRWITFGAAHSSKRGRFRFAYRFRNTQGVRIYTMRAVVPKQSHYPFARGRSPTVRVRVVG